MESNPSPNNAMMGIRITTIAVLQPADSNQLLLSAALREGYATLLSIVLEAAVFALPIVSLLAELFAAKVLDPAIKPSNAMELTSLAQRMQKRPTI